MARFLCLTHDGHRLRDARWCVCEFPRQIGIEVGDVVRAALQEMRAQGATLVDVEVPDLDNQLAAANLLAQELKFYLADYFRSQPGSYFSSVEDWIDSGLLSNTVEGFFRFVFPICSQPEDYLNSEDYRARLAAPDVRVHAHASHG